MRLFLRLDAAPHSPVGLRKPKAPYSAYLSHRGVKLPASSLLKAVPEEFGTDDGTLDYEALAAVLIDPDTTIPEELVDALFLIDEMATREGMNELLGLAGVVRLSDSQAQTPADVATQVYLL